VLCFFYKYENIYYNANERCIKVLVLHDAILIEDLTELFGHEAVWLSDKDKSERYRDNDLKNAIASQPSGLYYISD